MNAVPRWFWIFSNTHTSSTCDRCGLMTLSRLVWLCIFDIAQLRHNSCNSQQKQDPSKHTKLTKQIQKIPVQLVWPCTRYRGTPTPPWIPIAQRLSWNEKTKGIRQVGCHTKGGAFQKVQGGLSLNEKRNYTQKVEGGAFQKIQGPRQKELYTKGPMWSDLE